MLIGLNSRHLGVQNPVLAYIDVLTANKPRRRRRGNKIHLWENLGINLGIVILWEYRGRCWQWTQLLLNVLYIGTYSEKMFPTPIKRENQASIKNLLRKFTTFFLFPSTFSNPMLQNELIMQLLKKIIWCGRTSKSPNLNPIQQFQSSSSYHHWL